MMKQLKFSMKILKYGYGLTTNLICGGICFLTGLFLMVYSAATSGSAIGGSLSVTGGFLLSVTGTFTVQVLMSFNSTGILLSSPRSKTLLCTLPSQLSSIFIIVGFTVFLAVRFLLQKLFPTDWLVVSGELYLLAVILLLLQIFFAVAYHYFVASLVGFFLGYFAIYTSETICLYFLRASQPDTIFFTMPVTVLLCYGVLLIGILLNCLISRKIYKKPISKLAQGAALRKYL